MGDFGDARRGAAVAALLDRMVERRQIQIRALADSDAERARFSRVLRNPRISGDEIVTRVSDRLAETARCRHVLVVQDTTTVRAEAYRLQRRRLGREVGIHLHPSLALDARTGDHLGLCDVQVLRRDRKVVPRAKRARADRESRRWWQGMAAAREVLETAGHITHVFDAEGDAYEVLRRVERGREDLIVRCGQDLVGGARLFAGLDGLAEAACYTMAVAVTDPKRGTRDVPVVVRFGAVEIQRPKAEAGRSPDSVALSAVDVREIGAAQPGKAVHWRLLTTYAIETAADALEIIRLYSLRWKIEQTFRSLKAEGIAVGDSQILDADDLSKHAILAMVAAIRIGQLIQARDDDQGCPASAVFGPEEIETLEVLGPTLEGKTDKQRNPHPPGRLSWAAWMIARLGGWKGYKSEHKPGPKTFSRGLRRFYSINEGFHLGRDVSSP